MLNVDKEILVLDSSDKGGRSLVHGYNELPIEYDRVSFGIISDRHSVHNVIGAH